MESGACAVGVGLLQPQTGRPVTKHCTAQGLTTTTAPGIDTRNTASGITTRTLLNTVSIRAWRPAPYRVSLCACVCGRSRVFYSLRISHRAPSVPRCSGRPVGGGALAEQQAALRVFNRNAPSKRPHLLFSARAGMSAHRPVTLAPWRRLTPLNFFSLFTAVITGALLKARQIFGEYIELYSLRRSRYINPHWLDISPRICLLPWPNLCALLSDIIM